MRQNVIHLEQFYASRLGVAAQTMVARRLDSLWPNIQGCEILGFGYCEPFLRTHIDSTKRTVLAMPGGQGAITQSSRRGVIACLVDEGSLPFSDAQFDYVLIAHGLEEAGNLPELLRELWRVTKPEGRIVVIASNRAGLWAGSDKSPFGAGRPFSRTQLRGVLKHAGFMPTIWSGALYVPPVKFLSRPRMTGLSERFGEIVLPSFSGLVLVEAIKRLYAEHSGQKRRLVMRPNFGSAAPIGPATSQRTEGQEGAYICDTQDKP